MLSKAGVVGVCLLSRGKSTGPSPPFSVPLLIPQRVLGNGKGWLEPGSREYLGWWSKQHCLLMGKGMGGAARSEKTLRWLLAPYVTSLGGRSLGKPKVSWSWGLERTHCALLTLQIK